MAVSAVNTFRLRPGVTTTEFEIFSRDLDRPTCLSFDVVLGFDVFLVEQDDPADIDVIEIMTVASWPAWERLRDNAPELKAVVERFDELVEPGSVSTLLTRNSPLIQEI
ncbi:hypothetical protein BayCH28_23960 [Mycolicibacterium sp. CH28]|uniref:hypothetical protein n=1 Tax=Mycolicibacterium sp. CH28 TaxID=2512237 RepID=UPI00108095A6|nr:hypothetical protein [Mycolicibacterium sp. CH28]TGD84969.1 hypothetical protein BayCH28_23960 [Mycolicibacterium sp. CH28]